METVGQGPGQVAWDPRAANGLNVAREGAPQTCRQTRRALGPQDAASVPGPCPPPAELASPTVTEPAGGSVTSFLQCGPRASRHPLPQDEKPELLAVTCDPAPGLLRGSWPWTVLPAV